MDPDDLLLLQEEMQPLWWMWEQTAKPETTNQAHVCMTFAWPRPTLFLNQCFGWDFTHLHPTHPTNNSKTGRFCSWLRSQVPRLRETPLHSPTIGTNVKMQRPTPMAFHLPDSQKKDQYYPETAAIPKFQFQTENVIIFPFVSSIFFKVHVILFQYGCDFAWDIWKPG